MAKKLIRLTESELHNIILEATNDVLKVADSLITPFKTKYLFHCQNLRGAAAITIFE